jgi:hypothetical protein
MAAEKTLIHKDAKRSATHRKPSLARALFLVISGDVWRIVSIALTVQIRDQGCAPGKSARAQDWKKG